MTRKSPRPDRVKSNSGAASHSRPHGRSFMRPFGVWIQCQRPSASQCKTRGTRQLNASCVLGGYNAAPSKTKKASPAKQAGSHRLNRARTLLQLQAHSGAIHPKCLRPSQSEAATTPQKTAYPTRFNWPRADSSHPATLARTETQIHILTAGRRDICLAELADAVGACKAGNLLPSVGYWAGSSRFGA